MLLSLFSNCQLSLQGGSEEVLIKASLHLNFMTPVTVFLQ